MCMVKLLGNITEETDAIKCIALKKKHQDKALTLRIHGVDVR